MSALAIAKGTVHIVTALGVTKVITDVVKNNTTVETVADKVLVNTGSLVLGSMVVDAASKHVIAGMKSMSERFKKDETETTTSE